MLKRIEWWAENRKVLQTYQFGFRRGLCCADNIATLVTDIRQANKDRKLTGVIFLDLVGAFDNVIPEVLVYCWKNTASHPKSLLSSRPLPRTVTSLDSVKILLYADDIAIYSANENLDAITDQLNVALNNIYHFLGLLGLSISPSKSSFLVFSNMKNRNLRILIRKSRQLPKILDENIPLSFSARFLGVYLDSELNWKSHINQLRSKVIPRINIIKAISGIRWGAHPAVLINVYKGFIRPLLDWGCQVFHPLDASLYLKVCRLQYAALRTVTGMMCTIPTNALLDINGEQPLKTRPIPLEALAAIIEKKKKKKTSQTTAYFFMTTLKQNLENTWFFPSTPLC
ncbi:uncharacterized protein LOC114937665 [Nylanderia fulva]|uniref:uncharacterized protein LOC114937665 n=1 Tax=Nylanderia fulva TaxID=613905 RepID=UPI0010FAE5DB|nr:uncharacterized protein LOC114937665 [Nylanderia fulva]